MHTQHQEVKFILKHYQQKRRIYITKDFSSEEYEDSVFCGEMPDWYDICQSSVSLKVKCFFSRVLLKWNAIKVKYY